MDSSLQPAILASEPPFDVDLELQKLLGKEPLVLELPTTIGGITEILLQLRKNTVQLMAARLKRVPQGNVEPHLWKKLAAFLNAMSNLEFIDPKMKTQAQLDKGLQVIFNPVYKFPMDYAQVARHVYEKLEAERWGADEVEAEDIVEEETELGTAVVASSAAAKSEKKTPVPLKYSDFPAESDPIYGVNGIMWGILRIQGGKTASYQISPHFKSKNAKIFGDNGLIVGDCWPNQMALLRDGAHGQRMGGISGSATVGAYSIVVSGLYNDLDKDDGNELFYSGSNSHENTTSEPITSNKTKALERSSSTRNPVRVFRSAQGKWKHVPRAGLRYDGLYIVTSMSIEKNGKGGAYKRFKLVRMDNQDEISFSSPSQNLINLFERVRHGYTRTRPLLVPAE